jgi:hypothetical protein
VAIEWVVPAAVAVTKLLLRASGKADTVDAIDDAQEGWARLRRSQRNPNIITRSRTAFEAMPEIQQNSRRAAEVGDRILAVVMAQRASDSEAVVSSRRASSWASKLAENLTVSSTA